jgi:hypothetical protein
MPQIRVIPGPGLSLRPYRPGVGVLAAWRTPDDRWRVDQLYSEEVDFRVWRHRWSPDEEQWPEEIPDNDESRIPSKGGPTDFAELVVHDLERDVATTH